MGKGKKIFGVFLTMFLSFFIFDKASAMTLTEDWTLTEDTSESITVPAGATVTIDLNGHTITNPNTYGGRTIVNRGTMTIKGNGTITNLDGDKYVYGLIDNYGTLIVEGGNFVDNGAGDGSSIKNRGGVVTIKGGTFVSNAEANGNACIYSDGKLTIVDNISFTSHSTGAYTVIVNSGTATIGKINVSGVHGAFDVNSGTVVVNGGTYHAQNYYGIWITNNGNTNVTINGGSFTGRYGLYAAVDDGLQDDGDVAILINAGEFNGTVKSAAALNSKNSEQNWSMVIRGGKYNSDVSAYVDDDYVQYKLSETNYVVAAKEVVQADDDTKNNEAAINDLISQIMSGEENVTGVSSELADKIIEAISNNEIISTEISVEEQSSLSNANMILIEKEKKDSEKVIGYYDIDFLLKTASGTLGGVTEIGEAVTVTLDILGDVPAVKAGFTRNYYVLRIHDGVVERIAANVVNGKLTFKTDKFSIYTVVYEDVKTTSNLASNPKTNDDIEIYILLLIISLCGMGVLFNIKKLNA